MSSPRTINDVDELAKQRRTRQTRDRRNQINARMLTKPPEEKISDVYERELQNTWLLAGFAAMQGKRATMEDTHFYDLRFGLLHFNDNNGDDRCDDDDANNNNNNNDDDDDDDDDDKHDGGSGHDRNQHCDHGGDGDDESSSTRTEDSLGSIQLVKNGTAMDISESNDDTHVLIGVYDGHGGSAASHFTGNFLHHNIAAIVSRWEHYKRERREYSADYGEENTQKKVFQVKACEILPLLAKHLNVAIVGTDQVFSENDTDEEKEEHQGSSDIDQLHCPTIRTRTKRASSTRRPPSMREIEPSVEPIDIDRLTEDEMFLLLLREAFLLTNQQIRDQDVPHGTTASIAYVNKRTNKIYVANAGDSRVVLYRDGEPIRLTVDHRPNDIDEQMRVRDCGGFIINGRVNGILAVTRAIGDGFLEPSVSADPHVEVLDLDAEKDEFIVIACDGLWDVVNDKKVYEHVREEKDPRVASVKLRDLAFRVGSTDNISVGVIRFHKNKREASTVQHISEEESPVTSSNATN